VQYSVDVTHRLREREPRSATTLCTSGSGPGVTQASALGEEVPGRSATRSQPDPVCAQAHATLQATSEIRGGDEGWTGSKPLEHHMKGILFTGSSSLVGPRPWCPDERRPSPALLDSPSRVLLGACVAWQVGKSCPTSVVADSAGAT